MVEDKWLLLASIPVVVFLGISIRRRIIELNSRIEQLKREEAAGPVNPYQAMYEMMPGAGDLPPSPLPKGKGSEGGSKQPSPLLLKAMGKSSSANGHASERATTDTGRQEDNDG